MRAPSASGAPRLRAEERLAQLYEIGTLFLAFETIEQTFDAVLRVVNQALPLRSAILIDVRHQHMRTCTWPKGDAGGGVSAQAQAHIEDAYAYLAGGNLEPKSEEAPSPMLVRSPEAALTPPGDFIVIPLVRGTREIVGALQFEGIGALARADIAFASAIANQLAIALERDGAWKTDIRRREAAEEELVTAEAASVLSERKRLSAEALRDRYESLVDNLDRAFVWEADVETFRVLYLSARAETLLGYARQEWAGDEGWVAYVHRHDVSTVEETFHRAVELRADQRCEHRMVAADGRALWFRTGVHLVEDSSHRRAHLQGVSVDITAAKHAEEHVRERLDFIRAMAASLGEGVVAIDLESRLTFMNKAAEEMLRFTQSVAIDDDVNLWIRIIAGDGLPLDRPIERVLRTKRTLKSDRHSLLRADNTSFPVSYVATPILRAGVVTGAVLAFEDISEREQISKDQAFLLEATRTLSATLDDTGTQFSLCRLALPRLGDFACLDVLLPEGRIERAVALHVNAHERAAFDDAVGHPANIDDAAHLVSHVIRRARSKLVVEFNDKKPRRSSVDPMAMASLRALGVGSLMTVPVTFGDRNIGALTCVYAGSQRIHNRADVALAEELARRAGLALENGRLFEQAQRAIRAREEVLELVSHDLRTPLGTIVGSVALLEPDPGENELSPRSAQAVARIKRAAARMLRLVGDLLDFASIETGRLTIIPRAEDTAGITRDVVASFEAIAEGRGLRIEVEASPDVPTVFGDRDRIVQVLSNLVGNSIQVVPRGGKITLRVQPRGATEVLFAVVDTGPGIREEYLRRMFDRYWRNGEVRYNGFGLGLAIASGIVKAHGGKLWAESVVGSGATFYLSLPAARSDGSDAVREKP